MKETFILYTEYAKHIALLNMEQRGALFTAIMNYQIGEELPDMDDVTLMAFSFIRADLERTQENYQKRVETNRENGKKGGRPKTERLKEKPNGFEEKPKKPNGFFENPNDNESDSDNDNDNESDICTDGLSAGARETDEVVSDYLSFMHDHPNVIEDIQNPDEISAIDFNVLSERIAESNFLRTRDSLKWLIGNYAKIVSGAYRDFTRNRGAPRDECDINFILGEMKKAKEREEHDGNDRLAIDCGNKS